MRYLLLGMLLFGLGGAPVRAATCYGDTPCKACSSCRYCKHCAREGGKCGVCRKKARLAHLARARRHARAHVRLAKG